METVQFIPPKQRKRVLEAVQEDELAVLIFGEDGSGKGAIARYIHRYGPRSAKPLTEWSLPGTLAEAFLSTQGGTLVIESLSKLTSEDQKTLERFIHKRTVISSKTGLPTLVKARLIVLSPSMSDANLAIIDPLMKKTHIVISMPSLKERREEFEDIAQQLLFEYTHKLHKEHIRGIHYLAMAKLKNYSWPGNLRELRNVLSLAVIHAQGIQIQIEDLPLFGEQYPKMRSTRVEFQRIYLQELYKVYGGDLKRISEVTGLSIEWVRSKITTPIDNEPQVPSGRKAVGPKSVHYSSFLNESEQR